MKNVRISPKSVQKLREQKGWTQEVLAEQMSMSIRTVQRIEKNGVCSLDTLGALRSALDASLDQLQDGTTTAALLSTPYLQDSDTASAHKNKATGSSPCTCAEVYRLRIPLYRAFHRFIVSVVSNAEASREELDPFLAETHDALFLFDASIDNYLHEVYTTAVDLNYLNIRMATPNRFSDAEWEDAVSKEEHFLSWFTNQIQSGKLKFRPYLQLSELCGVGK